MAVFNGTIRSSVLQNDTQLTVVLPFDRPVKQQPNPCKVLYLLHGLGENCHAWCRYTGIERYARAYGIAVVMPEVQRSFYLDMQYGVHYFQYITSELPRLCAEMFHISTDREDSFIAGLSMGGYGALKCALSCPERYAGAASFSGSVDMTDVLTHYINEETVGEFTAVFGPDLALAADDNLFVLAERVARATQQPKLFLTCGEQDFLLPMNIKFRDFLQTIPLPFTFQSWEGSHEWNFWDASVRAALQYFFCPKVTL